MWAECKAVYTSTGAANTPVDLIKSFRDRIPWADNGLNFSATAVVVPDLRQAWGVAEQLRSQCQQALVQLRQAGRRLRKQDILRRLETFLIDCPAIGNSPLYRKPTSIRVLSHKDNLVMEYLNTTTNSFSIPNATLSITAVRARSRLVLEIETEATLCHSMLKDIANRGELRLQGKLLPGSHTA
jgi:hypothetical protein